MNENLDEEGGPALHGHPGTGETPLVRFNRNWDDLLQELRVTQTGIQILSGFLLTLPFQARFTSLDPVLLAVYLAAVASGTLATTIVLAPVVAHRILFRQHHKDILVESGHGLAKLGLACLALTFVLVVALIFGFVVGTVAALWAGLGCLISYGILWLWFPRRLAKRHPEPGPY